MASAVSIRRRWFGWVFCIVCCCSHCFWGFSVRSLFCFAVFCVLSSFEIISHGKREQAALLLLCSDCYVVVIVLRLFLSAPVVGLQHVIVVFSGHTHLPFQNGIHMDSISW